MVKVTVKRYFWDVSAKTRRREGDTFTATVGRAKEIDQKLPGYITYTEEEADEPSDPALSSLDTQELRAIAEERGIEVPKRASKQRLLELLGE